MNFNKRKTKLQNILAQPSLKKSLLVGYGKDYRYLQLDNLQRIRDFGTHSPKWDVSTKPIPSGLRELCEKEGGKIVRPRMDGWHKETVSSIYNRTDVSTNTERLL